MYLSHCVCISLCMYLTMYVSHYVSRFERSLTLTADALGIYLCIYLCIYLSMYLCIYLCIYLTIYVSILLCIYLFYYLSMSLLYLISFSIYPSIHLSIGHSFTGLLFVRTLDPLMESPVPASYAYKLMLFFIPSSCINLSIYIYIYIYISNHYLSVSLIGEKNNIVVSLVSSQGPFTALIVCACIVATWYLSIYLSI
jgi:hypothetical protein